MKALVATAETQGFRDNDFCWAKEGELVQFSSECDGEDVDGTCGCRRSMAGMSSGKGTTTTRVADLADLTKRAYMQQWLESQLRGGWIDRKDELSEDEKQWALEDTQELLRLASTFPVDAVVEKRGDVIKVRQGPGGWSWGNAFVGEIDAIWKAYQENWQITVVPGNPKTGYITSEPETGFVGHTELGEFPVKLPLLVTDGAESGIATGCLLEVRRAEGEVLWRCENYKPSRN